MRVSDVGQLVSEFQRGLAWEGFEFEFCDAWHLEQWRERRVPCESEPCLYLLTRPASPYWSIPLSDNGSDLWYVGKSNKGAGRVWDHFGNVFEPVTSKPVFPQNHRWVGLEAIPGSIRDAIAMGQCVVYAIRLEPKQKRGLPIALEKSVTGRLYQQYGQFPVLNLET